MLEDSKKLIEKLTGGKKLRKDQCLIIILVGILLCVIVIPSKPKTIKSDITDRTGATIGNHTTADETETALRLGGEADDYAGHWEERLEDTLRYVDGVGQVRVLITLRESEHKIVEKDGPETYSETEETDSAGGSRSVGESRIEKTTIYTTDANGQNVPYVIMTIPPAVEGVVVIAQGAGSRSVQENIIEAIQVLFDIDANKIKIVKMKK